MKHKQLVNALTALSRATSKPFPVLEDKNHLTTQVWRWLSERKNALNKVLIALDAI